MLGVLLLMAQVGAMVGEIGGEIRGVAGALPTLIPHLTMLHK